MLESLEQRRLLSSTFTVTTTCDEFDGGYGSGSQPFLNPVGLDQQLSLREAISLANNTPGPNTIVLPEGTFKITRPEDRWCDDVTGDFDIENNDLTIVGAGDGKTVVDGNGLDRVFDIRGEGLNVVFQQMAITRGLTDGDGGGIRAGECDSVSLIDASVKYNTAEGSGGGIALQGGDLTLLRACANNNQSSDEGGGIYQESNYGLGLISLDASSVANNVANNNGGGIASYAAQPLTLTNSQVDFNSAGGSGGGIFTKTEDLELVSSCVKSNFAGGYGGGIDTCNTSFIGMCDSNVDKNAAEQSGGGIEADGAVIKMLRSSVSFNTSGENGGGIDDVDNLTMTDSHIDCNIAAENGGGVLVGDDSAFVTLCNSTVDGNKATSGEGGGIDIAEPLRDSSSYYIQGLITLIGSQVKGNTANSDGGGIDANGDDVKMLNSCIADNISTSSRGGGISDVNCLQATDSQFTGNIANDGDGGGFVAFGDVKLTRTLVADNIANSCDGGGFAAHDELLVYDSTIKNNVATGDGGGIYADGDSVLISGSTFYDNRTIDDGGGIFLDLQGYKCQGEATLVNDTFTDNKAQGAGGAIFVEEGDVDLTALTISRNIASCGGGVFAESKHFFGESFNYGFADVDVLNSIIAGNTASTPDPENGPDVKGVFHSIGHNLIGIGDGSLGFIHNHNGDLVGSDDKPIDAMLDDLDDNGGPTWTMALLPGSPALNHGLNGVTFADQRGTLRSLQATCDIGAYEATVD